MGGCLDAIVSLYVSASPVGLNTIGLQKLVLLSITSHLIDLWIGIVWQNYLQMLFLQS